MRGTVPSGNPALTDLLPSDHRVLPDPRIALLMTIASSAAIFGSWNIRLTMPVAILAVILALVQKAWGRAVALPVFIAICWGSALLILHLWHSPAASLAALGLILMVRCAAVASVGACAITCASPLETHAALRAWHMPRSITVVLVVLMRFLPMVLSESSAVLDGMRLRGLTGGRMILRHPLLAVERFIVPMIAASLRASEDLSASAILRGMGGPDTPSALYPPRLRAIDGLWILLCAALVGSAIIWPVGL